MTYSPNYYRAQGEGPHSFISPVSVPIRVVVQSESENSGSTFVTPQQKRRRPVQQPHHRRNRKVSAPPELQAHLGNQKTLHTINFPFIVPKGGSPNLEALENSSAPEVIINFNNSSKLGIPEGGLNSGSDSGVPSEYSSWAAPVARTLNSSPYEDYSRSISASLDDIPNAGNLRREYISDSDDEDMNSPQPSQRSEGIANAGFVNSENQQSQPAIVPASAPSPHPPPPHPLTRAHTDTNLLAGLTTPRGRTNSMVFQLNLANGIPGVPNSLQHARSVSMISLNTGGNSSSSIPITYPNLSGTNNDTQSVYSDAGGTHNFIPGFLGLGANMGSQGSLSGVGYGPPGNINSPHNHEEEHEEPHLTDPVLKNRWLIDTLCGNLSTMYAILLFMVGCVLYLVDIFNKFSKKESAMGEAFNVYLIIVQLFWLGYIHVDVRKYVNTIANALQEAKEKDVKGEPVQLETTTDGHYQLRINLPEPRKTYAQYYGFTSGRHGGSLYLKIGAAVFCLGYLIHSGLNLGQKIHYIIKEDPLFESCTCIQDVLMSVLQPIYAFYQLFFIFKYSNLIINRRKRISKFALMHCISASLLFWVYTIIQETMQAISSKQKKDEEYDNVTAIPYQKSSVTSVMGDENDSEEETDEHEDGDEYYFAYGTGKLNLDFGCGMATPLTKMINDTTPYLYPFSIEYNILIVGIWILLWENIGRMDRHTHLPSIEMTYEDDNTKGITSNLIIYVDCHSSNRGLFAGLLMTVATIISIILFFIFTANDETKLHGLKVNGYSELIVHGIMIIVAILSYLKIRNLDIVKHKISKVDDILLYICLPCIFLYAVFSMVPAFKAGKPLFVAVPVVQVIQAVIQTALICDGLRRCSNSAHLNTTKPGREMITFMVVANVALWMLETFEIKSEDGNYYKYDYYGKEVWTLLSHMTLPLALFYRFHSSVCLVDIWKGGYEVESEH